MPMLNHKNVVRYFSCWVEAIQPSPRCINQIIKAVSQGSKYQAMGSGQRTKPDSSDFDDSFADVSIDN